MTHRGTHERPHETRTNAGTRRHRQDRPAGGGTPHRTRPARSHRFETEPWGERYFQVEGPNGVIVQLVQWVAAPLETVMT
jgi:hypothetical protein